MQEKHICVVTGTRAEYGLLKLLIQMINDSNKLKLSLLVTGLHLLKEFGYTINLIKQDGIPIAKIIPMYNEYKIEVDNLGKALGTAIINFTQVFSELEPDLLLVLGDRYESLAGVLAASTLSIPIAHIHGGDSVERGQIDEQIRHAITKFANIHFPVSKKSYERIKLLGEEEWRIYMVGSPGLDMIIKEELFNKEEICRELGLNGNTKIVLCIQHPYTFEWEDAGKQMAITLQVLKNLKLQTVIIFPNNDHGSHLILKEIEANREIPNFRIFKNLDRKSYLSLMKNIDLLIGNSSSGIIESPVFKLPVVNIGNRNKGRESGQNVINVAYDYEEIYNAVKKALSRDFKEFCINVKNPYGEGKASEKIVKILEDLKLDKKLLIKQLTFDI